MIKQSFKIHGDNIVECERMIDFILPKTKILSITRKFISLATIEVELKFIFQNKKYHWEILLYPGFNKANRNRWNLNIFTALKNAGSFLDETPDAIITKVENGKEEILCAIEFCSALQAGNQAWQRSGRAYSTMRTGCPYLYIVDFVKYELNTTTRVRKALRTPNAAVPFSYISNSQNEQTFGAQIFIKSEEFDNENELLHDFDENIFAEEKISLYLINLMIGLDTTPYENALLDKNFEMVNFFAKNSNSRFVFKEKDWEKIYNRKSDPISLSKEKKWPFSKKIAKRSATGNVLPFLEICKKYAYGITAKDLPFGIIPKENKPLFLKEVSNLYPISDKERKNILDNDEDMAICIVKGFKPRGDDNRPDRGILPLLAMLDSENISIFTYIYGPMTEARVNQIESDPNTVAKQSGFWNVFLALSDFLLLDVPIIAKDKNMTLYRENSVYKNLCTRQKPKTTIYSNLISSDPKSIHEDDVDSAIHLLFTSLPPTIAFEGLCNPPGGDWSGLSVIHEDTEYRWLSLPRVSAAVNGKRPDHVIQLFPADIDPIVLSIESKDRSSDLENNVGTQLKKYIEYLSTFIPSCERKIGGDWEISKNISDFNSDIIISVAAFINNGDENYNEIYEKSNCDLIFSLSPSETNVWQLEIVNCMPETTIFDILESILTSHTNNTGIDIKFIR